MTDGVQQRQGQWSWNASYCSIRNRQRRVHVLLLWMQSSYSEFLDQPMETARKNALQMQRINCIFNSSDYSSFCFLSLTSTIEIWGFSWLFCLICLHFAFEMYHNCCVSQIFILVTNTLESNLKIEMVCFVYWFQFSHDREFGRTKLLTSQQPRTGRNGIAAPL